MSAFSRCECVNLSLLLPICFFQRSLVYSDFFPLERVYNFLGILLLIPVSDLLFKQSIRGSARGLQLEPFVGCVHNLFGMPTLSDNIASAALDARRGDAAVTARSFKEAS